MLKGMQLMMNVSLDDVQVVQREMDIENIQLNRVMMMKMMMLQLMLVMLMLLLMVKVDET